MYTVGIYKYNKINTHSHCLLNHLGGKVLLLGAGDGRHILYSVLQGKEGKQTHFYVAEQNLMLICRQMLFMAILEEAKDDTDRQAKIFLEIFGNLTLSAEAAETVQRLSKRLAEKAVATQTSEGKDYLPDVDLSRLKSKELDSLEGILKFWEGKEGDQVDLAKFWEFRQRQLMGERYSARVRNLSVKNRLRTVIYWI